MFSKGRLPSTDSIRLNLWAAWIIIEIIWFGSSGGVVAGIGAPSRVVAGLEATRGVGESTGGGGSAHTCILIHICDYCESISKLFDFPRIKNLNNGGYFIWKPQRNQHLHVRIWDMLYHWINTLRQWWPVPSTKCLDFEVRTKQEQMDEVKDVKEVQEIEAVEEVEEVEGEEEEEGEEGEEGEERRGVRGGRGGNLERRGTCLCFLIILAIQGGFEEQFNNLGPHPMQSK